MKFPSVVIAVASVVVVASVAGLTMPVEASQYPYPPPPSYVPGSAIRFEITPKEAEVFADGNFAGSSMSSTGFFSGSIFRRASMKSPSIATGFERFIRPSI